MASVAVRTSLGIFVGGMTAFFVVFLVEGLGHAVFPPPAGLDVTRPEDQTRLIAAMPTEAQAAVVLAWFLGSLAGATAAITITRRNWSAWIVSGAVVVASFLTTQMFPHPAWMVGAAVVLPLAAAWVARHLVAARLAG